MQSQVAHSGPAVKYGPGPVAELRFWGQGLESIVEDLGTRFKVWV